MACSRTKTESCIQWGSINGGEIEFESLTENTLEGALEVIRKSFFTNKSICKAIDLISAPSSVKALEEVCLAVTRDGVSLVAIEVKTQKVVGVVLNKIKKIKRDEIDPRWLWGQPPYDRLPPIIRHLPEMTWLERFREDCEHHAARAYLDLMIAINSQINLFDYYDVDCIMECMFLATLPEMQQQNIGESLVCLSVDVANALGSGEDVKVPLSDDGIYSIIHNYLGVPKLLTAVMTCNYAQIIARRCRLKVFKRINYKYFGWDNIPFRERIGDEHRDFTVVVKKIKNLYDS